jgi:putative membrane protein
MDARDKEAVGLLLAWVVLAAISAVRPLHGYVIWLLEVAPVFIALAILAPTHRRFRFTPLVYRLMFFHACVLTLGAHYSYADVPLGEWVKDTFHLARNPYDRLGHLTQGFVPAIVAREVLVRTSPLSPGKWLFFLVTCVCLAFSAVYELIEWWVSLLSGDPGNAFLGTQGDIWDTQWDMFLCLCGAIISQTLFSRLHDRQLQTVT